MIGRRRLLALAGAGPLAGMALARPASAQIALYEGRLPDGFAYVRFANITPDAMELTPSFTDPIKLGIDGADRISPYHVVEAVAGKTLTAASGGGTVSFQLAPGKFHTFLLTGSGPALAGKLVTDVTEYNQLRVKLSFYNAAPSCASAGLLLQPSGQAVFSAVTAVSMRTRSTNATASAKVQAVCGATRAPVLDLGELNAGGLYTVWLMEPAGKPITFLAQDTIAAYQR